jgi:hypothetical protein
MRPGKAGRLYALRSLAPWLLVASLAASPAGAQTERLDVHGFGGWVFGKTNTNEYASATPDGSYGPISFALNVTAVVSPKLLVIAQPEWRQDEELELELDYAFAEWAFSDALRFRAGRVKHPFGIYTEIFDVGTVRPFQGLPQAMYGPVGFIAEGYNGVGIRGRRAMGRWNLSYDAYFGGLEVPSDEGPIHLLRGVGPEEGEEEEERRIRDVVGGRAVVALPVDGLSLGASGYTGRHGEGDDTIRHSAFGVQAEFTSERWWLRTEAVRHFERGVSSSTAVYGEAAYFLTSRWQLAARYGRNDTDLDEGDASLAPSLLEHEEWAAGVNLWLAPEFVLKGSFQLIHGNRLAGPSGDDLPAVVEAGALRRTTRLVQAGAQFSF